MSIRLVTITGEARGRNGWFHARNVAVSTGQQGEIRITVSSARSNGEMPPIFIETDKNGAREIAAALTELSK